MKIPKFHLNFPLSFFLEEVNSTFNLSHSKYTHESEFQIWNLFQSWSTSNIII